MINIFKENFKSLKCAQRIKEFEQRPLRFGKLPARISRNEKQNNQTDKTQWSKLQQFRENQCTERYIQRNYPDSKYPENGKMKEILDEEEQQFLTSVYLKSNAEITEKKRKRPSSKI